MNNNQQVKDTLNRVKYVCIATVNEDGSPHNSPVVFMYDQNFEHIYWGSHPDSQHSQNVLRTRQAFFVAFDSIEGGIGVYARTIDAQIVTGEDLVTALKIHNRFRAVMGKDAINPDYYQGNNPQRMWRAKVAQVWINAYERRQDRQLVKDYKIEIKPEELRGVWS